MKMPRHVTSAVLSVALLMCVGAPQAQEKASSLRIHLVWMGGNDCPPCVAWRSLELPKLEASAEFKAIKFTFVSKTIGSSVPPRLFLPAAVLPLKEKLDVASNSGPGSPQAALVVDGEVYDYFYGTRTADEILRMISAVREGTPYPFVRCTKMAKQGRKCESAG